MRFKGAFYTLKEAGEDREYVVPAHVNFLVTSVTNGSPALFNVRPDLSTRLASARICVRR